MTKGAGSLQANKILEKLVILKESLPLCFR